MTTEREALRAICDVLEKLPTDRQRHRVLHKLTDHYAWHTLLNPEPEPPHAGSEWLGEGHRHLEETEQ